MLKKLLQSEHGFGQWVIILVLMFGIGVGVWVAQIRTNYFPQASNKKEELKTPAIIKLKRGDTLSIIKNKSFPVDITIKSDFDRSRLISTHLKFNPADLEVVQIIASKEASPTDPNTATTSAFPVKPMKISQWIETLFDNKEGNIAITGLSDKGNIKTEKEEDPFVFATIIFKAKTTNETTISVEDSSLMLRSEDNASLLVKKENLTIMPVEASNEARKGN